MDLSSIDINEEVYKIDFKWFSDYEVKHLLAFKLLYSNPNDFFKLYKKKDTPTDTQNWVFEGIFPAYHNSLICEKLNSDYLNIKIPEKIKAQGETKILEFRNWVKENLHFIDNQRDFLDRVKLHFALSQDPDINFKKNGGITFHQNIQLETLEFNIQNLIQRANEFYSLSDKNKSVLDIYGKSSYWYLKTKDFTAWPPPKYKSNELWQVLNEFEERFKAPLKYTLQEYYRVKYKPELEFKGNLLDQLGFRACKSCTYDNLKFDMNSPILIETILDDEEIRRRVLELESILSRNSFQSIYSEIIPVKIERSTELPDRNMAKLYQLYVTKDCDSVSSLESIFSEIVKSNGEKISYEMRHCVLQIPKDVETFEPINRKLNKYSKARIYRIINSKPVLSDSEETILINRIKSLQDLVKDFNRIQYEGKDCFIRYFFSKTSRADIFRP